MKTVTQLDTGFGNMEKRVFVGGQGGNKRPIGNKMGGGEVETVSIVNS